MPRGRSRDRHNGQPASSGGALPVGTFSPAKATGRRTRRAGGGMNTNTFGLVRSFSGLVSTASASVALTLSALAPAAQVAAQGQVGPGVFDAPTAAAGLSPARLGVQGVHAMHMVRLLEDPPLHWRCALTVDGLPPSRGGQGGRDLLTGLYDAGQDVFVADGEALPLNSAGDDSGLSLHASGLLATFERPGQVLIARRGSLGQPWNIAGVVANLPIQTQYEPALADVDGRTHLLFDNAPQIVMVPLDLATLQVGPEVVVVAPARAGCVAHSAVPILDDNANLIGVSHHERLGTASELRLALDLDPSTPSLTAVQAPNWLRHGGFAGGAFFDVEQRAAGDAAVRTGLTWMPRHRARPGDDAFLDVYVGGALVAQPLNPGVTLVSPRLAPLPIQLPGFENALGVDPAELLILWNTLTPTGERAGAWLPVPADPGLTGLQLATQALVLTPSRMQFSNAALLDVRGGECENADCDTTVTVALGQTTEVSVGPVQPVARGITVCNPNVCRAAWGRTGLRQYVNITGLQRGETKVTVLCDMGGGKRVKKVICVTVN